jgi:hypothetical protein
MIKFSITGFVRLSRFDCTTYLDKAVLPNKTKKVPAEKITFQLPSREKQKNKNK